MNEFSLIDRFVARFHSPPSPRGPGDDCAVVSTHGEDLCVTTDALVEDVHFSLRCFSLEDVGYKALAVNLSDLAAMGARPRWFLCSVEMPRKYSVREVAALARGMSPLAARFGVTLIGGNLTHAKKLSLTLTLCGEVARGRALLRSGAKAQDRLYVSGKLGGARLGLGLMQDFSPTPRSLLERQRRPTPRVELGLVARGYASAGIDVSDGFAQDLGHLCRASGVGASVRCELLPVEGELRRRYGAREAAKFALAGGEDYELILAVPPGRAASFERACRKARLQVTCVGVAGRGRRPAFFWRGVRLPTPGGYDHFRRGKSN